MKDCNSIRPLLSEYVDGALDDNLTWEVKMHLSTCSVCEKVTSDFSATARLLSALPQAQPSANFEALLAKRLADHVLKPKSKSLLSIGKEWLGDRWRISGVSFASGAVLTAAVLTLVFTFPLHPGTNNSLTVQATPAPVASPASESDTLSELWQGHESFAASNSLGDRASLLTSADAGQPPL
jgi:anti-sigma factor RsiW